MPQTETPPELQHVLEFANKVRNAGGANPIDALMPSVPEDSSACLIARNLNFSCDVEPISFLRAGTDIDNIDPRAHIHGDAWGMFVEDEDVLERIAEATGLPVVHAPVLTWTYDEGSDVEGSYAVDHLRSGIELPDELRDVAQSFDAWSSGEPGDGLDYFTPFVEDAETFARCELEMEAY